MNEYKPTTLNGKTLVSLSTIILLVGLIIGYVVSTENRLTKLETVIENIDLKIEYIYQKNRNEKR